MTTEQKSQFVHLIGKRVKIIAKDHPWFGDIGEIKEFDTVGGRFGCIIHIDRIMQDCTVFNGKDIKYID